MTLPVPVRSEDGENKKYKLASWSRFYQPTKMNQKKQNQVRLDWAFCPKFPSYKSCIDILRFAPYIFVYKAIKSTKKFYFHIDDQTKL